MSEFWVRREEGVEGPFQVVQLKQLAASGDITAADFIRKGDDGKWVPTTRVRGLFGKAAAHSAATEEVSGVSDSPSTSGGGRRKRRKDKSNAAGHGTETGNSLREMGIQIACVAFAIVAMSVGGTFYSTVTEWFTGFSPDPAVVEDAQKHIDSGNYKKAIEQYSRVDADGLDSDEASIVYNNRGFAFAKLGNLKAAIADYTKGLQRNPSDVVTLENRRAAYRDLGDFAAAIRDQETVMRLRTPTAKDHEWCGLLYSEAGKSEEAMAYYDSSIEMDPTVGSAWFKRGILHHDLEQLSEAVKDHTTALNLTRDGRVKAEIHHSLALVFEEQGETADALANYESAIEWAQPYPDRSRTAIFHFNRGDLLENMGKNDLALADYDQAIALDRDQSAFFTGRASLLREMGKVDAAKSDEERVKELQATEQKKLAPTSAK